MKEKYLVINAGSSSLKYSLYEMPNEELLANGNFEKIGSEDSFYSIKGNGMTLKNSASVPNHKIAVGIMMSELQKRGFIDDISEIKGVGHRVLHGGEYYSEAVEIDDEVLNNIKELTKFGPLHHPGEIAGIESMQTCLPEVPQIAVFDTAFHQTMPEENYIYPVPYSWYEENGVRKYGFHGTSHKYITERMKKLLNKEEPNLIICHIGSGASLACIKDGKSIDTTMGLTPLDGLMMGTRSGGIDSSIIEYICHERGLTVEEVTNALNKESGLLGISGKNDYRDVIDLHIEGDKKAKLALRLLRSSVIEHIAKYYFELDGELDGIVFTAGIGENADGLRRQVINGIGKTVGIKLDEEKNNLIAGHKDEQEGVITTEDSRFPVFVIPTDEEKMILEDTYNIVNKKIGLKYSKEKVKTKAG